MEEAPWPGSGILTPEDQGHSREPHLILGICFCDILETGGPSFAGSTCLVHGIFTAEGKQAFAPDHLSYSREDTGREWSEGVQAVPSPLPAVTRQRPWG